MTEEVETLETAGKSSQPAPDATADSSTANPTDATRAKPSAAQAEKKTPTSMSEALSQVKLEEPEAGKPAAGESATTGKAESDETKTDEAGNQDEQSDQTGKVDDSANDPFNKRPEWGELNKALGKEGAKKARPIIRNLMEREHRATEQFSKIKPVVDELRQHTGDEKGFQQMRSIVRAYATDPGAAIPILEQMLTNAKSRAGHVVTSPDLKTKLDAVQKKLDDGLIDEETANMTREALLEAEKGRAGAKNATERVQQTETQRQQEARATAQQQTLNSLNSWEENVRGRDADFGDVTPAEDPRHGESIADRVFDALQLKFMADPKVSADKLIAEANRVYKLAKRQLVGPAARESRPLTAGGSSVTAKPAARTMREAMDAVKLE